jgi:hypothetical protein
VGVAATDDGDVAVDAEAAATDDGVVMDVKSAPVCLDVRPVESTDAVEMVDDNLPSTDDCMPERKLAAIVSSLEDTAVLLFVSGLQPFPSETGRTYAIDADEVVELGIEGAST